MLKLKTYDGRELVDLYINKDDISKLYGKILICKDGMQFILDEESVEIVINTFEL